MYLFALIIFWNKAAKINGRVVSFFLQIRKTCSIIKCNCLLVFYAITFIENFNNVCQKNISLKCILTFIGYITN